MMLGYCEEEGEFDVAIWQCKNLASIKLQSDQFSQPVGEYTFEALIEAFVVSEFDE